MPDYYKYVATNENGEVFLAINRHDGNYGDFQQTGSTLENSLCNNNLRLYKYDSTLLEESRELIAEKLIDCSTTTMKATTTHVLIFSGKKGLGYSPNVQVVNLSDNTVETIFLDQKVKEIIDII